MRFVFLSNYFTHHQKPLSQALSVRTEYYFIETARMTEERKKLGWGMAEIPDYVYQYHEDPNKVHAILERADVVIAGSAPESLVRSCIRRGQLVLRYCERPLKNGLELKKYLPRLIKWHWQNPFYKKIYLLCASAYTAEDYAKFGLFRGKAFKWGYFPETVVYDNIQSVIDTKEKTSILWVGRLLDWKHPDDAIRVAAKLKEKRVSFNLTLVGTGPMEAELRKMIAQWQLQDCVRLVGAMKPEQVRRCMELSQIFLFTSDRKEGWGAVLNEAMNSGCAVVASYQAGSTPYLIKTEENGLIYQSGDIDELTKHVLQLLNQGQEVARMGGKAYFSVVEMWNAELAAERLVELANSLWSGEYPAKWQEGPCSLARDEY